MSDDIDSKFEPHTAGSLDDLALLPGEFRTFAREVRSSFELLANRIMPALTKIETTLVDLALRISDVEKRQNAADDRQQLMDSRLADLEARIPARQARRAKR